MDKLRVYHFHNGSGGGVFSVIKNLIRFSSDPLIENHIIYTINRDLIPSYAIEPIENVVSQAVYYYSPKNNFYHTVRQLARLLPDDRAFIIAHDWLELGMSGNLGLPNPVVHFIHGNYEYYYELAKKHSKTVDAFICVSPKIEKRVKEILPTRIQDIFFRRFPVPVVQLKKEHRGCLNIVYCVRDLEDENKRFSAVKEIAALLSGDADKYFFHICAAGKSKEDFYNEWPTVMAGRVTYHGLLDNDYLLHLLSAADIFLLPSVAEGLPVSLIESMKAGLVPLVTCWDDTITELVSCDTGFTFEKGDITGYVSQLRELESNRTLLKRLSLNAAELVNRLYDPQKNTGMIEAVYINVVSKEKKRKYPEKIYGSRLDMPFMPNILTKLIRRRK